MNEEWVKVKNNNWKVETKIMVFSILNLNKTITCVNVKRKRKEKRNCLKFYKNKIQLGNYIKKIKENLIEDDRTFYLNDKKN